MTTLRPDAPLLTVSNRGPIEFSQEESGRVRAIGGQGGLATALRIAAQLYPATWLSSPLTPTDRLIAAGGLTAPAGEGASRFVITDEDAYALFYGTFANEVLWFLQHGMPWPEDLTREKRLNAWRHGYERVNRDFADAIVKELGQGCYRAVSIHDYHFYALPAFVRQQRPDVYMQHFIHIPWPGPQEWRRLEPELVRSICAGLAANDSLVFQTEASARNYLQTCREFLPGAVVDLDAGTVCHCDHEVRVWANGISADPQELSEAAATPEFRRYRYLLRGTVKQKTIVRVDRLDPTKNALRGFQAYELLLQRYPELRERVTFLALLVPTKSSILAYQRYQKQTQDFADGLNRRYGNWRWKPVHTLFEHNRMQALAALSFYDVLLVNPIADGMNLVAKEGPLLNDRDGVLVLSQRAGAYQELGEAAVGIDPEDVEGTAEALFRALTMPVLERVERARRLDQTIRHRDLRDWFRVLLQDVELYTAIPKPSAA